jgi:Carboxypeptidase regulatory-like domain
VLGAMCYVPGSRRDGCAPGTDLHGARSTSHLARSTNTAAPASAAERLRPAFAPEGLRRGLARVRGLGQADDGGRGLAEARLRSRASEGGQIPNQRQRRSAIQGQVTDQDGRGVPGAEVVLKSGTREIARALTTADGVFRFLDLPGGGYTLTVTREGYQPLTPGALRLGASELASVDLKMTRTGAPPPRPIEPAAPTPYGRLPERRGEPPSEATPLPPGEKVFVPVPERWNLPLPEWDRYNVEGDYPYVSGRWWDPYNQNRLKGDYPVLGKRTFFVFTGISDSLLEGRNLPTPSGVSTERQGSERFFGRGGQYLPVTAFRTSFDLFRGDTAFRPIDWRVRVAPAFSVNVINLAELQTNADVRRTSNRLDTHLGLQEAFVEKKLFDLSSKYDFMSVRAGIQEFSSDFRGFISVLEAPGIRLFGTLKSSRIEYNVAYFDLLEKDTNSGFNELHRRRQQVYIANVYIQDFLTPGYTTAFSFHANRDQGELHYDTNGFLVRPAPIGLIGDNTVRAYYIGWAGNGHIGRWNVSHAFYQALGHEEANAIEAAPVDINAQMAALELSLDKDWIRFKGTTFVASGDDDPNDGKGRGFDAVVDIPTFAGGTFSLWNRQGLRLAQTGTGLVSPLSLLPSLRTNKDEGQANFVNPGIVLVNGAVDVELTPKLRGFLTTSYLRFMKTEVMEALLFQQKVRPNIGVEYGAGASYRPPLSENIVLIGGVAGMKLGQGLKDIYERNHLFSVFANLRLQF